MSNHDWNIDAAHTGIHFSVRHMVVSKVRGRFAKYSGKIRLDDADITRSSVEVSIDASSIDTGVADRDTHLRSPDFFDVEKFPELNFRSKRIEQVENTRFRVVGAARLGQRRAQEFARRNSSSRRRADRVAPRPPSGTRRPKRRDEALPPMRPRPRVGDSVSGARKC